MEKPARRDPAVTSRIMAAVKGKNTGPELLLRRALHARGLRYRLHAQLPGKPDIVFPGRKLAVFVDGDFWHGHGWQRRGFASFEAQFKSFAEPERWTRKIERNIARDAEVEEALQRLGWRVVRLLESEIRTDTDASVVRVLGALQGG